ncbi:MAG: hypothetical protein NTU69_10030 [Proteobacteria bacterium]|jgi:hypothetical protein|nr:hypothetical protein [Pseudomonadota bacterium]
MKNITLEAVYQKVVDLQQDIVQLKKSLMEEPELRRDFIMRMKDIEQEKSIMVEDFGKRYGLR